MTDQGRDRPANDHPRSLRPSWAKTLFEMTPWGLRRRLTRQSECRSSRRAARGPASAEEGRLVGSNDGSMRSRRRCVPSRTSSRRHGTIHPIERRLDSAEAATPDCRTECARGSRTRQRPGRSPGRGTRGDRIPGGADDAGGAFADAGFQSEAELPRALAQSSPCCSRRFGARKRRFATGWTIISGCCARPHRSSTWAVDGASCCSCSATRVSRRPGWRAIQHWPRRPGGAAWTSWKEMSSRCCEHGRRAAWERSPRSIFSSTSGRGGCWRSFARPAACCVRVACSSRSVRIR